MKTKRIQFMLSLLILATLACNLFSPGGTQTTESGTPSITDTVAVAPPIAPATDGPCANPYYPVVQGATWIYFGNSDQTGAFSYTETITAVRADGFTLSTQFSEVNRTQEWACKPEGLQALQLGSSGAAAAISASGMNAQFTSSNVQGITIPANPQPGSEWTYSLDLQGTATINEGMTTDISGTVSLVARALAIETVTVPAGTFNALKIQVNSTFSFTATLEGFPIPITLSGISYLWYAPGVGLVKTVDTGDFSGEPFSATTELQSYAIP